MKHFGKHIVQWILFWCATVSLKIHRPFVIAISGSTDKTLVKELLSDVFKHHGHTVRINPKSFNTEIGLPLAILYLPSGGSSPLQWLGICVTAVFKAFFEPSFPPILIVELGVDHPGDMEYLLRIVHPRVAIVTTCTDQYLPNFHMLERYAQEFERLVKAVPRSGLVVLNTNDERIRAMEAITQSEVMTIGERSVDSISIHAIQVNAEQQSWTIWAAPSATDQTFSTIRPGSHHRFAHTAAFSVHQWYDNYKAQS